VKHATLRVMDTPIYTVKEYVALEKYANTKHELIDGEIHAMSGGTLEHSRLAAELIGQLKPQLRGRACKVFTSDARVRIVEGDLITYPDVSICCGSPQTDTEDPFAMTNPTVLIEVTSPSSEKYDRGTKLERYKLIPSLREYVVVSHRERAVDLFRRLDGDTWSDAVTLRPGERVRLASIDCEIDVDALYSDELTS
jgi:Uma2 family endonuclease